MTKQGKGVVVFARQPVPGLVKTRLARDIGAKEACDVYGSLLRMTLAQAALVDSARFLFLPPGDRLDPRAFPVDAFQTREQQGPDLGARMDHAFRTLFDEGLKNIVLVGSDCPYLTGAVMETALAELAQYDTVFGRAADGGYYLVGQADRARDLFTGIPWSTRDVWDRTMQILARQGWSFGSLPELEDIDDRESLKRFLSTQNRRKERITGPTN